MPRRRATWRSRPMSGRTTAKKERAGTFVDLFAGCGGLSMGLELAGFQPVFVNELNRDAMESYLLNREQEYPYLREPKNHVNDIYDLTAQAGELDALAT